MSQLLKAIDSAGKCSLRSIQTSKVLLNVYRTCFRRFIMSFRDHVDVYNLTLTLFEAC